MQAQEPVSVHFSERDGVPDKEFYDVIEDNKGFIWLAANKGLFRYDGKTFKGYNNEKQRGLSVFGLKQDTLGRIWCTNISGQFFYIQDDKLVLFSDLNAQLKGELAEFVILENHLAIFTYNTIYTVNLKTKQIESKIGFEKGYGVPFKLEKTFYFGSFDSILSMNLKGRVKPLLSINQTSRAEIRSNKSTIFKVDTSMFIRELRSGKNTFFQFNPSDKSFKSIASFQKLANKQIRSQLENEKEIWFGTNSGVWIYEFTNNRFQFKKQFLKDKNITKIIKDRDNNYWFTTLNEGIYIIPNVYVETYDIKMKNKNITSMDAVNDSMLVFGNANGNIELYNIINNKGKLVELPTKDRVSVLRYHPQKNTVFISRDISAYTLNYKTLQLKKVRKIENAKSISILEKNDLLHADAFNVRLLKNANLNNEEIFISKRKRTYASHYIKKNKKTYIAYVDDLVVYDTLWRPKKIRYKNKSIYGKHITETSSGIVWIATFKDGILGIKNDEVIHHYTTVNGLTSNNIQKIKADRNKLWIALDNSVQLLDTNSGKVKTLTKREGVLSYDISGIEMLRDKVFLSSNEGLFSISKEKSFKTQNPEVYFNLLEINEKDTIVSSGHQLKYNQNAIKIGFHVNGFLYNQKGKYRYRLKGFNDNWLTTGIGINSIKYNSLPAGEYIFQVQPVIDNKIDEGKIKELAFFIKTPFWKTWWFILLVCVFILGSIILYFRIKIRTKEKERAVQLEQIALEKELISINLTALRSQMNPHFIFNALNSIQDLILKQDTDTSYDYIVLFAKLIRNTLDYSNQDFISIEKEMDFLKVYLQLEKLRFGETFKYTISFDEQEDLEVPSLLIQPFIENALVHGLLHKTGEKKLDIIFSFTNNVLQCVIIDNGIGRKKTQEIASRQGNHHKSFALSAIEKRLEIFKKQYNQSIGYVIEDLYKGEVPKGTKVLITMPFKKRF